MPQGLHVGVRAEQDGWTTSAELAGPGLQRALAIVGRQLNTDRLDIQGQRIVEVVAWWIGLPAAHALLDDRLPDLSPENTQLWVHESAAPDDIGTLVHEERYLPASLTQLHAFVEAHVTDLVSAASAHTKRPSKALWRGVNDRIAAALIFAAQTRGEEARGCALAKELYQDLDLRTLELTGYSLLVHVRSGCCLYYRIPERPKCWGCPLLSDDERRALTSS